MKKKREGKIGKKDAELWKAATKDVDRLKGRDYVEGHDPPESGKKTAPHDKARIIIEPKKPREKTTNTRGAEVDRRTDQRLKRGKMEIEATIDLHGMGQAQAQESLTRFIKTSHDLGRRCVLVITGKGLLGKPGIIKTRLPDWLRESPLAALVLKSTPAQLRHGGEGAVYVLLRRRRDH